MAKTTVKKVAKAVKTVARSDEYKEYMELLAVYKEKNPAKYEAKKARIEAKLKSL